MTKEFIQIALDNIYLIENSPTESLHKSKFKYDTDKKVERDAVVEFLFGNEFIETDRYDEIYFLTRETYEYIDLSLLEGILWSFVDADESVPIEKDYFLGVEIEHIEQEIAAKAKQDKVNRNVVLFFVLLMISWVSFEMFRNKGVDNSNIKLDQEQMNELSEIMKSKVDSLKAINLDKGDKF